MEELQVYSNKILSYIPLKRIILCKKLTYEGQSRAAVPIFASCELYLDTAVGDSSYLRKVFHHELFHLIAYRMDKGKVYEDIAGWSLLNDAGFVYGNGGKNMQHDGSVGVVNQGISGFLNMYSTSGVEEDKAEMFAYMVFCYDYVLNRSKDDGIIEQKMSLMKDMLNTFCSDINEHFWYNCQTLSRSN
eukprot:TRINITY_DN4964_c0_g1_i2.p1 TRINITY_DN4964_c0_g1~~TRINITY_DN4964_c0_g1_i2.p1  ORF type:complete len:188 (+),score=33.63 TRINITY_DN4964_c0_g1_i2:738-1301(+)